MHPRRKRLARIRARKELELNSVLPITINENKVIKEIENRFPTENLLNNSTTIDEESNTDAESQEDSQPESEIVPKKKVTKSKK